MRPRLALPVLALALAGCVWPWSDPAPAPAPSAAPPDPYLRLVQVFGEVNDSRGEADLGVACDASFPWEFDPEGGRLAFRDPMRENLSTGGFVALATVFVNSPDRDPCFSGLGLAWGNASQPADLPAVDLPVLVHLEQRGDNVSANGLAVKPGLQVRFPFRSPSPTAPDATLEGFLGVAHLGCWRWGDAHTLLRADVTCGG